MFSFIKNLLGFRTGTKPETTPGQTIVEQCPACGSKKVAVQFGSDNKENDVRTGGCVFIDSGTIKRICQNCAHVWGEERFNTTACIMMKPKKQE